MKVTAVMASLLFMNINLYAQTEWIAITPASADEKSKSAEKNSSQTIKISPLQPAKILVEKVKVIQHLLDKKETKKEPKAESKKNWFIIENRQNDK